MNKTTMGIIAVIIIEVSFWGGMKYGQSGTPSSNGGLAIQNGQGRAGGQRGSGARGSFNGASGSIISKDATSITVSLRDGSGSKIIFISPSTTVNKQVAGTANDLVIGKEVMVTGAANADGSINAESIQLRSNFSTSTTR